MGRFEAVAVEQRNRVRVLTSQSIVERDRHDGIGLGNRRGWSRRGRRRPGWDGRHLRGECIGHDEPTYTPGEHLNGLPSDRGAITPNWRTNRRSPNRVAARREGEGSRRNENPRAAALTATGYDQPRRRRSRESRDRYRKHTATRAVGGTARCCRLPMNVETDDENSKRADQPRQAMPCRETAWSVRTWVLDSHAPMIGVWVQSLERFGPACETSRVSGVDLRRRTRNAHDFDSDDLRQRRARPARRV